jgi:hypothetical protein
VWRFLVRHQKLIVGAIVLLLCYGLFFSNRGRAVVSFLRGDQVFISGNTEFQASFDTESLFAELEIWNTSFSEITLLGAATECDCTTIDGVPSNLGPFGRSKLKVAIAAGRLPNGKLTETAVHLLFDRSVPANTVLLQIAKAAAPVDKREPTRAQKEVTEQTPSLTANGGLDVRPTKSVLIKAEPESP